MRSAAPSAPYVGPANEDSALALPALRNLKGKRLMEALFQAMIANNASDLHLCSGTAPRLRIHGNIIPIAQDRELQHEELCDMFMSVTPEKNKREFKQDGDTDFVYQLDGVGRFRSNLFMDRNGIGGVFRAIPDYIPSLRELGLPSTVMQLCRLQQGLILVTGPTGSGKSTTLAAMVDHINSTVQRHIITLEDPIEFVHKNKRCLVNQRQVGVHTVDFRRALRAALREDPDIVLVGEMRDLATIEIAIETAETGHLVFGTLHTRTAMSTVDRIIEMFPEERQNQIRVMLADSLKGVISQSLCGRLSGGQVAAFEIMVHNRALSNLIREGKSFQINSLMQTRKDQGMLPLNDSLVRLVRDGLVHPDEAIIRSADRVGITTELRRLGLLQGSTLADEVTKDERSEGSYGAASFGTIQKDAASAA